MFYCGTFHRVAYLLAEPWGVVGVPLLLEACLDKWLPPLLLFLNCHLLSVFFDDHVLAIKLCYRYKGIILRWYT